MIKNSALHIDLGPLNKLRKQWNEPLIARIGVMGAKAQEKHEDTVQKFNTSTGKPYSKQVKGSGTITNAALAAIHEFGSFSRGIVIRSFLRLPLMLKSKEIVKFAASKEMKALLTSGQVNLFFKYLGVRGEQVVQRAFETQGYGHWDSVKPETAKRKGNVSMLGTAEGILIQSGQLRRAVSSDVVTRK